MHHGRNEKAALIECYTHELSINSLPLARFNGVTKQSIQSKLSQLPPGLVDDEHSLALTRAANELCGVVQRMPYTDTECKTAVYEHMRSENRLTKNDVTAKYGLPRRCLMRLCALVRASAGDNPSDVYLRLAANALQIPKVSTYNHIPTMRRESELAAYLISELQ